MRSRSSPFLFLLLAAGCGKSDETQTTSHSERAGPAGAAERRAKPWSPDLELATRRQVDVDGRPEGLLGGDFDADGKRDLVATSFAPGAVHFWRGSRTGLRPADAVISVGDYPLPPVALDARPSTSQKAAAIVAVASRADRKLRLLEPSSGALVRTVDLPATPRAIAAGDVDGDERPEIAVAVDGKRLFLLREGQAPEERALSGELPRCAAVLRGARAVAVGMQDTRAIEVLEWPASDGAPQLASVLALPGIPRAIAEADLDGDGDLELAVAGGERSVWVYGLGTGGGARGWSADSARPLELDVGTIPIGLVAADVDADGRDDLLALAHHGVRWSLWSRFEESQPRRLQHAYAGQTACAAAFADLDGDGRADLVTANRDSRAISVFLGLEGGKFAAPAGVAVGSFPVAVSAIDLVGDLDGDRTPEIAAVLAKDAALSVIGPDGTENARVERARIPLGGSPRALACGDLDGDGRDEAASIVRDATSSRVVVLSPRVPQAPLTPLTTGELGRRLEARLGRGGSDLLYLRKSGARAASLLGADPDGDEVVWFEALSEAGGEVRLGEIARAAIASGPRALALVHAGEVREPALAVALGGPGARTGIALLRRKERALEEWCFFPSQGAHRDVAAGDLDGDGRDDLVLLSLETADGAVGWIEPWMQAPGDASRGEDAGGSSAPRFMVSARARTTARPQALAVADLDGDGRAEILCACLESHVVDAWKSVPSEPGKPLELRRLPGVGAGLGCADVRIADLDGDGHPEILVADSANDEVSIISRLDR